ncbi:DUF6438 domain-containing protein [Mucilaginibacter paludis]|uniref:DUF6438 domain-containing protein n=1 Tax=Mucilaginibacter paludis DSM 18603 TaxID=714943 RepID=H1YIV5_9SPHI|nr:DUF6438 domain-containing protein [Mucilaginibacter paludis]EHQ27650.1 hypothetical protein Mucpa_3552 [Mucilaginibacter paludis DSM 18603]
MKQYLTLLLLIAFLSSCDKHWQRQNEITKIEIATGGCFGPCQSTIVSIDSSLDYKYFGGDTYFTLPPDAENNGKLKGYYSTRISAEFWDTLNIKLESINYKKLDTLYQHSVDDQSLEVFIHYNNKIKHIKAQSASLPDSVAHVFYYLSNSYKFIKPKSTKDIFRFESESQRPRPMPNVHNFKFPPPSKKSLKN